MKLMRFRVNTEGKVHLGVLTPLGILDAESCMKLYALATSQEPLYEPRSVLEALQSGPETQTYLKKACDWALSNPSAQTMLFHSHKVITLAPIERPPKILCIGRNYRDHCAEEGVEVPKTPLVFAKYSNTVLDPEAPILRPRITKCLDYEAELGVVIGTGGKHIHPGDALSHVGGYLNFNDVSARDLQFSDGQWLRGKSCDTFAPMGPVLVTTDEIPDPQNLKITCRVNGETRQESNTREMVFPVAHIISFISNFCTLEPGDIIATGTPPGVGFARKPPKFLKEGDIVEIEVEGLGILRSPVQEEPTSQ